MYQGSVYIRVAIDFIVCEASKKLRMVVLFFESYAFVVQYFFVTVLFLYNLLTKSLI